MNDQSLNPAEAELLKAINYFVKRQELVAQALRDFGLDFSAVAILGAGGWMIGAEGARELLEVSPNNLDEEFRNTLKRMVENNTPKLNQEGSWQDKNGETWNYFMHGGGCRLVNQTTDEPIDWDCPSTIHFDTIKFCYHLRWQIEKSPEKYPYLISFLDQNDVDTISQNLIPELVAKGRLTKDSIGLYRVS